MSVQPMVDRGQQLPEPEGKVIGFLPGQTEFEEFIAAVRAAGYPAASITSLCGADGLRLLERQKDNTFFFADAEDDVLQLGMQELASGHYAVAVEVADHKQAQQIANLARPLGGHGFSYFGAWISEQLS